MANIEKRRRIRKLLPAVSILIAVTVIALIAFLAVIITKHACSGKPDPEANVSSMPSASPSVIPSVTADTPAPSFSPEPDPTLATPKATPSRVSGEMSYAMLDLEITKKTGEGGETLKFLSGSFAVQFVNNTDSPMYSAEFNVSVLSVGTVTVNGFPAKFTFENGRLSIPFLSELWKDESFDIFFTFEALTDENELELFSFGYDTAFGLSAVIRSEIRLALNVPEAEEHSSGSRFITWSCEKATVHSLSIRFQDQ